VTAQLVDNDIRDCISDENVALATRGAQLVRKADEGVGADNVTAVLVQC
jgi:serine/threonine protein phosphatase PrpC